jgi:hypothetical protein
MGSPREEGAHEGTRGSLVLPGRAPAVEDAFEEVPGTLARARLVRGTWERLLSAASSRT